MRFTKMQGAGNDYIYIDCFTQPAPEDPAALARVISDRHFGVGGDGLILIGRSAVADGRMRMFNADGSEAEMCGNGIRCVAKYLFDHGLVAPAGGGPEVPLTIETGRGVLSVTALVRDGTVHRVRVDMGEPILASAAIPTTLPGDPPVDAGIEVDGQCYRATCVSMGNPHCVIYVEDVERFPVAAVGRRIETDRLFPRRTNVEFVQVVSPRAVIQRTWERGSGETLACGTGACAVVVAGVLSGRTERRLTARVRGGDLELDWAENNHVMMTGPAVEVFSGEWTTPLLESSTDPAIMAID